MREKEVWTEALRRIDSQLDYLYSRAYTDHSQHDYNSAMRDSFRHRETALRVFSREGGTPQDIPDPVSRLVEYWRENSFPEADREMFEGWQSKGFLSLPPHDPSSVDYQRLPPDMLPKTKMFLEMGRSREEITTAAAFIVTLEAFRGIATSLEAV